MTSLDQPLSNDPAWSASAAGLRVDLRNWAVQNLPEAMVPSHFVIVPALPKLPNGKVDRRKLPALETTEQPDDAFVEPRNDVERAVARIWQDLLNVTTVGAETSFFDLGGDSLSVIKMAIQVGDDFETTVDLQELFTNPTVAHLASLLSDTPPSAVFTESSQRSVAPSQLMADAVLPTDIAPTHRWEPDIDGAILVTGGTGYTGAFLLRELLDRSDSDLFVLARADRPDQAAERVLHNLETYGLAGHEDRSRIHGFPGDTGRPYLGLTFEDYRRVSAQVRSIVHNAAMSSWALPYDEVKPTNVFGALEVLRLACDTRTKAVHFVSTVGVYPGHEGERAWSETPLDDPVGVVGGYRQSKWVADSLMAEARQRGLPVSSYRLGAVTGARHSGACSPDTFINHLLKGCIQIGAYLDYDLMIDLVPVDYCAAVVAHSAVQPDGEPLIYNVPAIQAANMNDVFELVVNYGYPLRRLAYDEWRAEIVAAAQSGEDNALLPYLPLFGPAKPAEEIGYEGAKPIFETGNLERCLRGTDIACPPVDQALFNTYIDYFVETGYLPSPPGG